MTNHHHQQNRTRLHVPSQGLLTPKKKHHSRLRVPIQGKRSRFRKTPLSTPMLTKPERPSDKPTENIYPFLSYNQKKYVNLQL